ncbi:MAG: hypothetical protein ABIJ48_07765 [Actinomycetota bacterium]
MSESRSNCLCAALFGFVLGVVAAHLIGRYRLACGCCCGAADCCCDEAGECCGECDDSGEGCCCEEGASSGEEADPAAE